MTVLVVDPGLATGLAGRYDDGAVSTRILPYPQVFDTLEVAVRWADTVAYEAFTITSRTLKLSRQYEVLYVIGALLYLCHRKGITPIAQQPGDALTFTTDAKLKQLGWYRPGPGHDNAAAKHLRLYLANHEREIFTALERSVV